MTSGKDATDIGSDSPCESAAAGGRTAPGRAKRPPVYSRMARHRMMATGEEWWFLARHAHATTRAERGVTESIQWRWRPKAATDSLGTDAPPGAGGGSALSPVERNGSDYRSTSRMASDVVGEGGFQSRIMPTGGASEMAARTAHATND